MAWASSSTSSLIFSSSSTKLVLMRVESSGPEDKLMTAAAGIDPGPAEEAEKEGVQ